MITMNATGVKSDTLPLYAEDCLLQDLRGRLRIDELEAAGFVTGWQVDIVNGAAEARFTAHWVEGDEYEAPEFHSASYCYTFEPAAMRWQRSILLSS